MVELKVFDSVFKISEFTYNRLHSIGNLGSAALSFGSTYNQIFRDWKKLLSAELLSEALEAGRGCSNLPAFFPADERIVDFDDPDSNWGTAVELFLSTCGNDNDIARHPKTEAGYRGILETFFQGPPAFDIIFLGLGTDGHTASLFPGNCPAATDPYWHSPVLQTTAPFEPPNRLSLGPEVIARSKQLLIVVTGKSKTEILGRFLDQLNVNSSARNEAELLPPARIIKRRKQLKLNTLILTDKAVSDGLPADIKKEFIV